MSLAHKLLSKTFSAFDRVRAEASHPQKARRLAVIAGTEPKSCSTCLHWNQEEGQNELRKDPMFLKLTTATSGPKALKGESGGPLWSEYGACTKYHELTEGKFWCGNETSNLKDAWS